MNKQTLTEAEIRSRFIRPALAEIGGGQGVKSLAAYRDSELDCGSNLDQFNDARISPRGQTRASFKVKQHAKTKARLDGTGRQR